MSPSSVSPEESREAFDTRLAARPCGRSPTAWARKLLEREAQRQVSVLHDELVMAGRGRTTSFSPADWRSAGPAERRCASGSTATAPGSTAAATRWRLRPVHRPPGPGGADRAPRARAPALVRRRPGGLAGAEGGRAHRPAARPREGDRTRAGEPGLCWWSRTRSRSRRCLVRSGRQIDRGHLDHDAAVDERTELVPSPPGACRRGPSRSTRTSRRNPCGRCEPLPAVGPSRSRATSLQRPAAAGLSCLRGREATALSRGDG